MKIKKLTYIGIVGSIVLSAVLILHLLYGTKSFFLANETSHGHYQIELKCESCHSEPFIQPNEMQKNCEKCHALELEKIDDTHPKQKFLDPRNILLIGKIDARFCVTCHREHQPEITRQHGLTTSVDFCINCHADIVKEKKNHQKLEFKNCTNSGCHNFHDNTMLYENFLIKHLDEGELIHNPVVPRKSALARWKKKNNKKSLLDHNQADIKFDDIINSELLRSDYKKAVTDWQESIHAKTDTNCSHCHNIEKQSLQNNMGNKKTDTNQNFTFNTNITNSSESCKSCHKKSYKTFVAGKHGMRLSVNLSALDIKDSKIATSETQSQLLECDTCHNPHTENLQEAAVEVCIGCHKDEHSANYKQSKHYSLWQNELSGVIPEGSGVSCATCHLPRIKKGRRVEVMHNQNFNLRPNNKMLRSVCMKCHGMGFSMNALADEKIIRSNFKGSIKTNHPTFDLVKERIKQSKNKTKN